MKLLVKYISLLLSYIIPENKKIIVFSSSPDFCDNAYAVFYYMIRNHDFKDYKFYWIVSDKHKTEDLISEDGISLQNNVFVLKRNTIISLWYTFRAKYLFYSVGIYTDFTFHNQRKRINMWHGMPLKHVGFDFRHGDFTIATSELFSNKMSNSLNIPLENVLITGQPRNDFLFHPELLPKYLCYIKKYSTVGIWMPTFRRSDTMAQHVDGSFDPEKISYLKISELEALNTILKRSNSILLIKFHPYDVFQKKKLGDLTNIKFIYNNCMHQKDLYILLSHCNYLLSDFSSVVVDYEILNRPIGITMEDFEEYKESRGFDVDKIPGEYIYSRNELFDFIYKCSNGMHKSSDYGCLYNEHRDDKATKRLLVGLNILHNE